MPPNASIGISLFHFLWLRSVEKTNCETEKVTGWVMRRPMKHIDSMP
jgi:hypothetical protein